MRAEGEELSPAGLGVGVLCMAGVEKSPTLESCDERCIGTNRGGLIAPDGVGGASLSLPLLDER